MAWLGVRDLAPAGKKLPPPSFGAVHMHAGHLLGPHRGGPRGVKGDDKHYVCQAQSVARPQQWMQWPRGPAKQCTEPERGRNPALASCPRLVSGAPGTTSLHVWQPGRLGAHLTHTSSPLEGNIGFKSRSSPPWGPLRNLRKEKTWWGRQVWAGWADSYGQAAETLTDHCWRPTGGHSDPVWPLQGGGVGPPMVGEPRSPAEQWDLATGQDRQRHSSW